MNNMSNLTKDMVEKKMNNLPKDMVEKTMNNMSNLPKDMVEEILSRIPLTSIKVVRSICRKWNGLFKDGSFMKKHLLIQEAASREGGKFMAIMLKDFDIFLMSFDLGGIYNNDSDDLSPFVEPKGKLINHDDDSYKVDIIEVCHCDGLLLCITKDYTSLVVSNPYTGQTRRIAVENPPDWGLHGHALGYDKNKSTRAHKILRFGYNIHKILWYKIFDLNSNSWRIRDVIPNWYILFGHHGHSLKGNTYWFAYNRELLRDFFLLCFDFTTELFGPNLPLPFVLPCYKGDAMILSSLREEQLAILYQPHISEIEIWVTTKIEPSEASWSKFFAINMEPLRCVQYMYGRSCLVDEEKRGVIVFGTDDTRNIAYIIGANGYFKEVDLGKLSDKKFGYCHLPRSCSYAPSSVQMNQSV